VPRSASSPARSRRYKSQGGARLLADAPPRAGLPAEPDKDAPADPADDIGKRPVSTKFVAHTPATLSAIVGDPTLRYLKTLRRNLLNSCPRGMARVLHLYGRRELGGSHGHRGRSASIGCRVDAIRIARDAHGAGPAVHGSRLPGASTAAARKVGRCGLHMRRDVCPHASFTMDFAAIFDQPLRKFGSRRGGRLAPYIAYKLAGDSGLRRAPRLSRGRRRRGTCHEARS